MQKVIKLALAFTVSTGMFATTAFGDFSYTTTRKTTGGAMAAMAGTAANVTARVYLKGQKMKVEDGNIATLMDFDAQTITTVNNARKTISVRSFSDLSGTSGASDIRIDAKETGQRKTINGFDARELLLTMEMDMSQGRGMAGKMQMEVDMWISSAVPGAGEMKAFYAKNSGRFPWTAMAGGDKNMQAAMAEVQKRIAAMDGVPVEQIIRVKPAVAAAGGASMPQMPQMTGARGGAASGNSSSLIEITADSAEFSTAGIADAVFAAPAGYTKSEGKQ